MGSKNSFIDAVSSVRERIGKAARSTNLIAQTRRLIASARAKRCTGQALLITNLAQMGDVVLCLGVAAALRERNPDAILLMAVQPEWHELIQDDPILDGTLSARTFFEIRTLCRAGLLDRTYLLDIPIPTLLHYFDDTLNIFRYAPPTTGDWYTQGKHLMALYEQNAGLAEGEAQPRIYIRSEDSLTVEPLWTEVVNLPFSGPIIALHTHSSMAAKNWPVERFAELIDRWKARHGARFIVVGGPGEGENLKSRDNVALAAGTLSPRQTAEVIRRADYFIGLDSGMAYIAEAVGTPGFILLGATTKETSGPRSPDFTFLRPTSACQPACHRACTRTPLCILALDVDTVDATIETAFLRTQRWE